MVQSPQEAELDPVVRAVAEARARDAGKSVSDYLADLLMLSRAPSAAQLLTTSLGHATEQSGDELHSFSRYLLETARDIRDRHDGDQWSRLVAGQVPWLASEATASPALRLVFVFNYRIQSAALLMSAAFHEAAVNDFEFAGGRSVARHRRQVVQTWYSSIVHNVIDCSQQLRNALVHEWKPTPRAERLAIDAFVILSDLSPARNELLRLCSYDRPRAFSELARHVELAADQFRLSTELLAEVEGATRPPELASEARFSEASRLLLQRAGGGLSLTEAARLLGTSRQALHKRVKTGTAFGLMDGAELTLPKFQFVEADGQTSIVEGLGKIIRLFDTSKAGRWSALQFFVDEDPNLSASPIQKLISGEVQMVVGAAAAYLDVEEE